MLLQKEDFSSPVKMFSAIGEIISEPASSRHLLIVVDDCQLSAFGWEHFCPPMRDATTSSTADAQQQPKVSQRTLSRKLQPCPCSPDSDHTSAKKKKKTNPPKSVSFSNLAIREHGVILGDHPHAKTLALALSWEHTAEPIIHDIDTYEKMREGLRRKGDGIRMTYIEKRHLLREHGHSESEINLAQRSTMLNRDSCADALHYQSGKIRRVKTLAALQQRETE